MQPLAVVLDEMSDDLRVTPGPADTAAPQSGLLVSLLGPMQVEFDGQPMHVAGRQRRRLLARPVATG